MSVVSADASPLPAPAPPVNPETAPFWEGAGAGQLILPRCEGCGWVIWYPRQWCPSCGSSEVKWFQASGAGTLHSFSVIRRGGRGPYSGAEPYVLAYVELTEGPRILTNIIADPGTLEIGMLVTVEFHKTGDGSALVRFRPKSS